MKGDLDQKRDLLTAMESDLSKAVHWNGQISDSFHKCDVDLSKYADLVGQMSDRWRRIQTQIDSRWDNRIVCTHSSQRPRTVPRSLRSTLTGTSLKKISVHPRPLPLPLPPTLSSSECGTWKSRRNSWLIISRAALSCSSG